MSVMNILRLELNYFRNYIAQKVELSPNVNIFSGDNAQGKTNLLEAVYFMSLGKSMRTPRDKELIMWNHKRGRIKAEISKNAGVKTVEIVLDTETNKRVAVNGMPITRIGELMGVITTVLFSPDEIDIIKDTPQKRRRFMDIALCQLSKSYFYCLSDYNKILAQRNKLLKKSAPAGAVEVWDMQLIARCAKITRTRREFVRRLEKYAAESHLFLTDGRENLQIKYEGTTGDDEKEIKQNFSRRLKDCMEIDYKHGYTHCGPQGAAAQLCAQSKTCRNEALPRRTGRIPRFIAGRRLLRTGQGESVPPGRGCGGFSNNNHMHTFAARNNFGAGKI